MQVKIVVLLNDVTAMALLDLNSRVHLPSLFSSSLILLHRYCRLQRSYYIWLKQSVSVLFLYCLTVVASTFLVLLRHMSVPNCTVTESFEILANYFPLRPLLAPSLATLSIRGRNKFTRQLTQSYLHYRVSSNNKKMRQFFSCTTRFADIT